MKRIYANYLFKKSQRICRGFTLIEIVVASALLMTVTVVGIANFNRYSEAQKIKNTAMDLSLMLQKARSRAQSQVKPSSISTCQENSLKGYEVRLCNGLELSCPVGNSYGLYVHCGTSIELIDVKKLPDQVSFGNGSDTSFYFEVLKGTVSEGAIVLVAGNTQKTIAINNLGGITILE